MSVLKHRPKLPLCFRSSIARPLNRAREYQAIIAYVIYSQVLKGAAYMAIAKELEVHAAEELKHAITVSKHIDVPDVSRMGKSRS